MQISEATLGIDLGTSHSCAAVWINRTNRVEIIQNDEGQRLTPSVVSFSDRERLIGDSARSQAKAIHNAKRLLGRRFDDAEVRHDLGCLPFSVVNRGGRPYVNVNFRGQTRFLSMEEITSMVITKMKDAATTFAGSPFNEAVVTVPASFNSSQRRATVDACAISGLNARLIDEPSAVAIAYNFKNRPIGEHNIIVVNLGGGSYDVTLLTLEDNILDVQATAGNSHFGGEDFDNKLVEHFIEIIRTTYNKDPLLNPRAMRRLRTACERAKRVLSSTRQALIEVDALFDGVDFYSTLSRSEFEVICEDLFSQVIGPVEKVLKDARMDKSSVQELILVGGSSRIPKVISTISNYFDGKSPNKTMNVDEAASFGAAIFSAIVYNIPSELVQTTVLLDVRALSLGVETTGGVMCKGVKQNTTIPVRKSAFIPRSSFGHEMDVLIKIYEGEQPRTKDNIFLGQFVLPGTSLDLSSEIEIVFDIESNGGLKVVAKDNATGTAASINLDRSPISQSEIARMTQEAEQLKAEDRVAAARTAARNELETFLYDLRTKTKEIEEVVDGAIDWLDRSDDHDEVDLSRKQQEVEEFILARLKSNLHQWNPISPN